MEEFVIVCNCGEKHFDDDVPVNCSICKTLCYRRPYSSPETAVPVCVKCISGIIATTESPVMVVTDKVRQDLEMLNAKDKS